MPITKSRYRFWRLHVKSCRFQVIVFKSFHFEKRFQVVVFKLSFSSLLCKQKAHPQRKVCVFERFQLKASPCKRSLNQWGKYVSVK